MPTLDPTPLIQPAEHVTVDTAHLATAVTTLHHAIRNGREPFRYQVVASVEFLRSQLSAPLILNQQSMTVEAEPLWWVIQAADELGNDRALSPVGALFGAVDDLGVALIRQAPATDRGMVAVLEAECVIEVAAHTDDQL